MQENLGLKIRKPRLTSSNQNVGKKIKSGGNGLCIQNSNFKKMFLWR